MRSKISINLFSLKEIYYSAVINIFHFMCVSSQKSKFSASRIIYFSILPNSLFQPASMANEKFLSMQFSLNINKLSYVDVYPKNLRIDDEKLILMNVPKIYFAQPHGVKKKCFLEMLFKKSKENFFEDRFKFILLVMVAMMNNVREVDVIMTNLFLRLCK